MPLKDTEVRFAKSQEKPYKLPDGAGLYLLVHPKGGRYWRFNYRFGGKQLTLALGTFPEVGLAQARVRRQEAREHLAAGRDPAAEKKRERLVAQVASGNTFETVAKEWLDKKSKGKNFGPATREKIEWQLSFAYPDIGGRPVAQLTAPELLAVLRKLEARERFETAGRLRSTMSRVFRYAISVGLAERDPAADLIGALVVAEERHHAAIFEPKAIGGLLRAIDGYDGEPQVRAAMRLAPLTFVRPGELRMAEWKEFDLDAAEWRIPGSKMKMGLLHIVPLSRQAVEILRGLHRLTGEAKFLFSSLRTPSRPMSENTINAALRRLGYSKEEMTGHGFRRIASTLLHEMGPWESIWIERQLAHVDSNAIRGIYNAAEYLPARRRMMQAWADHLDGLRGARPALVDEDLVLIG